MAEDRRGEKIIISENGSETAEAMGGAYAGVDMREIYEKKPVLYKLIKRLFDIFGSAAAMVILSPVFIVTSIAVKACDGGPAFYSGMRYGKDMKIFPMHKFRSMCVDAESKTEKYLRAGDINGLAFKIKNDPRVTTVGRFIRRTSIDELPQLWNVFKGEMSLVGPRPIQVTDKEINEYEKQRWIVKPGITCFWQVSRREFVPWDEWVDMDLRYIREMSILTDIRLMFETVGALIYKAGHR
jgi:lipopolysaccharide/colanic/teichoic acid biosynthesis glycosyltransferase